MALPEGAGELPDEALRLIVDRTANPFVVIDAAGRITFASGTTARYLGWPAEQLVGRNMAEILRPDQLEAAAAALAEIDAVDHAGAGVPMAFAITTPDGGERWIEVGAMPLLDEGLGAIVLRTRPYEAQQRFDDFVAALLADDELGDVLPRLLRSVATWLEADGATLHAGWDGERFVEAHAWGVPTAGAPLDAGPWCLAADREPTWAGVGDLPAGAAVAAAQAGLAACWAVPVPPSGDLAPAVLTVWRSTPGPPLVGHRHVLGRCTRYAQLALVRRAEHERLRHLAGHDALTGVANRVEFRDHLARALANGERALAVAFCDLDGFKAVNDAHGHPAGDQVLVEVAQRLRAGLRTGDELARIGGDEFTILLRAVPDAATAAHVAERLVGAFADPFAVAGGAVRVGLSIGIALVEAGAGADDLLARADAALYEAKRAGGGDVRVATPDGARPGGAPPAPA